jgi:pimeloyl-ACP methyl ester carboxylesterase
MTYMRLYPVSIRCAIIDSGASLQQLPNIDFQRGEYEELERIFSGCAANAACNSAYPGIRDSFFELASELQDHPVNITIRDFAGGPITVHVDAAGFYFDVFGMIFPGDAFSPDAINPGLAQLWRATHGELRQVYQEWYNFVPFFVDDVYAPRGKTESYWCHDLIAFETRDDFRQAARDIPGLAPHFLDPNIGLPIGPAGCEIWGVGRAGEAQHQPLVSDIPTLVLAGEYDTGTPPFIVRQIPGTLSNSFYFEFPAGAHLQLASYNLDSVCARDIATQFLDDPAATPDSSCIASLPPFDFTPEGAGLPAIRGISFNPRR